jgi:hypothetical protein
MHSTMYITDSQLFHPSTHFLGEDAFVCDVGLPGRILFAFTGDVLTGPPCDSTVIKTL